MSGASWREERDSDGIVWLTLDRPGASVNTLAAPVLDELGRVLARLTTERPRGVVLRSGKASGFVLGADVKEFTTLKSIDEARALVLRGHRVLAALEELPCPSVALIEGIALGGGLELALACRYRVALDDERLALGLPEVMLGIHPGFGGTVRAVRTLGAAVALDMMLTGRSIKGSKTREVGLVDTLCTDRAACELAARELIVRDPGAHRPPMLARLMSAAFVRPFVKPRLLAQVARRVRREHYPAPYAIIDLWARCGGRGDRAYAAEADSIALLAATPTARNLIRVFMLQDALKSRGKSAPSSLCVHVIGAGVMGSDIAALCARRGLAVSLQDRDAALVEKAVARITADAAQRIREPAKRAAMLARLKADATGQAIDEADVIIEAIIEDAAAKRALFAALEQRLKPGAIIATNTSSIRLEELAPALASPERLVGLHFFNPVALMPLVEIVQAAATSPATLEAATALARKLDKLPLPCRSAPGFLVNRVLVPYLQEAMHAAEDGFSLDEIDRAATDFGMPVGPVELSDMVGLDVCRHVGSIVARQLERPAPDFSSIDAKLAIGHAGRKSGHGFYAWRGGKVVRDDSTSQPLSGVVRRPDALGRADLQDRLLLALVNECVAVWRERLVDSPELVDAGVIFGTGFAPFRGGPLHYAHSRGIDECTQRLRELAARYGDRFTPDAGWMQLPTPKN